MSRVRAFWRIYELVSGKPFEALGRGFIGHHRNDRLRGETLFRGADDRRILPQLLRIVYRLLFLFVAEDRELLHPPYSSEEACNLYDTHYSTRRLRELALKIRGSKHADLWHSLSLVFDALSRNEGLSAARALRDSVRFFGACRARVI